MINSLYNNYKDLLSAYDWYKGRCIDTSAYEARYTAHGYKWNTTAQACLSEFGDLRIPLPNSLPYINKNYTTRQGYLPCLDFTLETLVGFIHYGVDLSTNTVLTIDALYEWIGTRLCPVGDYETGHDIVFAGEDGFFYVVFMDGDIFKVGRSAILLIHAFDKGEFGQQIR